MQKSNFNLCGQIKKYFDIQPFMEIIPWAQKYIDFSNDISAQRNKLDFSLYPYQVDIIKEWQDLNSIKTVTVVAPEQMGKTNLFVVGMLWRMVFAPSQQIICYPNDSLAVQTNQTKILPLMRHIPQLKAQLEKSRSYRSDRFNFSNCISYFQGAGAKIVSKSAQVAIGDEVDAYPTIGKIDNVADLKKRTRSYDSSILFLVCTPSQVNGKIWKSFLKSSMGYWHLRCQKCGELTIRSCDIQNLQFQSEFNEELKEFIVKDDSIVLVCPKCGFEHTEDMKREMNINGGYIHKIPERMREYPGYQIGALASQLPALSWKIIAQAQLEAGKRADIELQTTFDNSFRGLPYKRRQVLKQDFEKIKQHCWKINEAPSLENVEMVFMTADTQDNRSVVCVFAMDVNDNLYLLSASQPEFLTLNDDDRAVINKGRGYPIITVEDMLNKEYLKKDGVGIKPTFCVIDRQGHRSRDVEYFAKRNPNVLMYQGYRSESNAWKMSDNNKRLCLVSAKYYQTHLIYYLYSQKKRGNNYLYFYPEIQEQVIKQILSVKPDPSTKFGNLPQHWVPENNAQHDFFDALKMAYFSMDFAVKTFRKDRFRFCKSPNLLKRWEKLIRKQQLEQIKSVKEIENKESWFNVE